MLLQPDCISCIYKASLAAIRGLTSDKEEVKAIVSEILQLPALRVPAWGMTSPEVFEPVLAKIAQYFHVSDPFKSVKEKQNKRAMDLYPWLKKLVAESADKFRAATNLAIIGNSLDVLWSEGDIEVEPIIRRQLRKRAFSQKFDEFKERLLRSRFVLILGDNSGEIVFDKLFIETIRSMCDGQVVYVVRSIPTLNDATLNEAAEAGMDRIATVIDNGIDGPVPGTILSRCSEELRKLSKKADLIISKGGGNFDSLEEEIHLHNKIFFLLMSKCVPYCTYFGTKLFDPILSPPTPPGGRARKFS